MFIGITFAWNTNDDFIFFICSYSSLYELKIGGFAVYEATEIMGHAVQKKESLFWWGVLIIFFYYVLGLLEPWFELFE